MDNFDFLINMRADEARTALKEQGYTMRYVSINDQPMIVTADYRLDRVNVAAKHNDDGSMLIITYVRGLG